MSVSHQKELSTHSFDEGTRRLFNGPDGIAINKTTMSSSRLSPVPRSHSRASVAASVTTYHSFQDVDVYEPSAEVMLSPPATVRPYVDPDPPTPPLLAKDEQAPQMRRQDSGYESLSPRQSQSRSRRRTSSTLSSSPPASRHRKRPSIRRAAQSGPVTHLPRPSVQAMYHTRSHQAYPHPHSNSFFHFPEPATRASADGTAALVGDLDLGHGYDLVYDDHDELTTTAAAEAPPSHPTPPPQTTHYWTSDRTRRLEYAAIDAASRGVRGWVMRHMVPECFVPRERRRVCFDDDAGSVRRYRLELECEESAEKEGFGCGGSGTGKQRKVWWSIWKTK